jgi:ADP-ribose pyrophosphatase YjhB (NUDIX family)
MTVQIREDTKLKSGDEQMAAVTHAGGIVFQKKDGKTYYLIVRAKPNPSHWVIPKGHIEPGESPEVAAVREIQEEAGVKALIIATLGLVHFTYRDKQMATVLYLLEYLGETLPSEQRESHWGLFEETLSLLTFPNTREMLRRAQTVLRQRESA